MGHPPSGPSGAGGTRARREALAECYRHALLRAVEVGAQSVAFPSISTGAYGYPLERAAPVAIREVRGHLAAEAIPRQVLFVCLDEATYAAYRARLAR